MSSYDKLGDLLKDAIDNNEFPKSRQEEKKEQKKYEAEPATETVFETEKKSEQTNPKLLKFKNEFKILKLEPTDDTYIIKEQYHKLLKKYHPDNVPKLPLVQKTAAKKTQEIVEAYKTLSEKLQGI